jgi:hypothetical protein
MEELKYGVDSFLSEEKVEDGSKESIFEKFYNKFDDE